jgi:hypothetical protein
MTFILKYIFFAYALAHEKGLFKYSFEHLPRRQNACATCSMLCWACLTNSSKYRSEKWVCHYQCATRFIQKKHFTTSMRLIVSTDWAQFHGTIFCFSALIEFHNCFQISIFFHLSTTEET